MVDEPLAATPEGVEEAAWEAACAAVRAYCGWHVAPVVEETLTLDGSGAELMFLPSLRVVDLVSITDDGTAVDDPEWSEAGMVRRSSHGRWTHKFRGVVAVFEHGYTECPPEVLAVLRDSSTAAALAGVSSVTSGSHQVQFEASLSSRQRTILDRYRIVNIA